MGIVGQIDESDRLHEKHIPAAPSPNGLGSKGEKRMSYPRAGEPLTMPIQNHRRPASRPTRVQSRILNRRRLLYSNAWN